MAWPSRARRSLWTALCWQPNLCEVRKSLTFLATCVTPAQITLKYVCFVRSVVEAPCWRRLANMDAQPPQAAGSSSKKRKRPVPKPPPPPAPPEADPFALGLPPPASSIDESSVVESSVAAEPTKPAAPMLKPLSMKFQNKNCSCKDCVSRAAPSNSHACPPRCSTRPPELCVRARRAKCSSSPQRNSKSGRPLLQPLGLSLLPPPSLSLRAYPSVPCRRQARVQGILQR